MIALLPIVAVMFLLAVLRWLATLAMPVAYVMRAWSARRQPLTRQCPVSYYGMTSDFVLAARWLGRNPLFMVSVVSVLALGTGAVTSVFSIVDAVLLRPLPYKSAERLARIDETATKRPINGVLAADYFRWRERTDLFEATVPYLRDTVTLTAAGEPDQIIVLRTSGALFPVLGTQAQIGRTLLESDDVGATRVAVLSDRLWRRKFGADPGLVGRPVTLSDEVLTVAGVMPRDFEFPSPDIDAWIPFRVSPEIPILLQVLALLKPGITFAEASSALEIVARQIEQENPNQAAGLKISVHPWRDRSDRSHELTLLFVLAAVGLVLLIACVGVASLLLSRAVQRQPEIAIRVSLGAGSWRVARQLVAEGFVLALLGTAAGLTLAHFAVQVLSDHLTALPDQLPHLQRVSLNGRVLLFNGAICLLTTLLCCLAPIVMVFRSDLQGVLRGVRTGNGPKTSTRLFSFLIGSEAAFASALLVGSGLMIHSLVRLQQDDFGFRPDHVLTLRVPLGVRTPIRPAGKYDTRPLQIAYYDEILRQVETVPGLQAAAVVNNLPLSGVSSSTVFPDPDGRSIPMSTRTITPRYFEVMGIPLLAGRYFNDADQATSPGVAIVNEHIARQLFPHISPIGQRLPSAEKGAPVVTIVGVVRDTSQVSYDQPIQGEIYRPMRQFIFATFMSTVVVRAPGDPLSFVGAIRNAVWSVDPSQPIVKAQTMNDTIAESTWRPRFSAWIFSVLATLAVLLTAAGVYGVVAYTSSSRTHEMGIRIALGASPTSLIAAVVRSALLPICVGLAVGLLSALLLSRLLESLLYEVRGTDVLSYLSAAAILLIIGAVASVGPAWRLVADTPAKTLLRQ